MDVIRRCPTGRGGVARVPVPRVSLRYTLHPTDEDLSVGTPAWATFVSSLREEERAWLVVRGPRRRWSGVVRRGPTGRGVRGGFPFPGFRCASPWATLVSSLREEGWRWVGSALIACGANERCAYGAGCGGWLRFVASMTPGARSGTPVFLAGLFSREVGRPLAVSLIFALSLLLKTAVMTLDWASGNLCTN